jgi:hypothetical protein
MGSGVPELSLPESDGLTKCPFQQADVAIPTHLDNSPRPGVPCGVIGLTVTGPDVLQRPSLDRNDQ